MPHTPGIPRAVSVSPRRATGRRGHPFLDGRAHGLPGGDVDEMFRSLQQLSCLSGDPTVFRGTGNCRTERQPPDVKRNNYVYRVSNLEQWRALMGG